MSGYLFGRTLGPNIGSDYEVRFVHLLFTPNLHIFTPGNHKISFMLNGN